MIYVEMIAKTACCGVLPVLRGSVYVRTVGKCVTVFVVRLRLMMIIVARVTVFAVMVGYVANLIVYAALPVPLPAVMVRRLILAVYVFRSRMIVAV